MNLDDGKRRTCSHVRHATSIGLALVVLAGCTNEPPAAPAPPTSTPTFSCPNQAEAMDDRSLVLGESSEGDVDGDGSPDSVSIHLDESGEPGCEAFLVALTHGAMLSIPIWRMGGATGLPEPRIRSIVDIDGDAGDEIVVDEAAGASTQFVGVYGIADGRLAWLRLPAGEGGLFPYGGSVGHLEAVDCSEQDEIVVTSAIPAAGTQALELGLYEIERTFYRRSPRGWAKSSAEHEKVPLERLEDFPEFAGSPFGSCLSN